MCVYRCARTYVYTLWSGRVTLCFTAKKWNPQKSSIVSPPCRPFRLFVEVKQHRTSALGIAHCFTKKWNPQKVSWTFSVHYVYFFGSVRLTLFPCYGNLEPEMMEYSALIHRGTSGNVVGVIVHCLCKSKRNKYREGFYVH